MKALRIKLIYPHLPAGFFHISVSFAQMERKQVVERTQIRLKAARDNGRIGRHKRLMTPSNVESAIKLLKNGVPVKELAENLDVSVKTLYRWIPATVLWT